MSRDAVSQQDWTNRIKGIESPMPDATKKIDITADICPMTFVRTRLALDRMNPGETLMVWLKGEEPLQNVPRSATEQGHEVLSLETDPDGISHLLIRRGK
jgi:tRNA 2-thiouridine synthesizing protein A